MAITFAVDDVAPAEARRATFSLADRVGRHMALGAGVADVIEAPDAHPLLAAVHVAFAEHRPLVLSPDAIWLTIAQGVAQHVRLHAEALRPRFVQHQGKQTLSIRWPSVPASREDWSEVTQAFRARLAELVGSGWAALLGCAFSTTTPDMAVAADIVLMDVFSPYAHYELLSICGIPEITLLGTPADWREIRARVDALDELDLGFWTASLRPIADQLVAAALGRITLGFWRALYKPAHAYGPAVVTGWIARLYPYLDGEGRFDRVNPMLAEPLHKPWVGGGMVPRDAPSGTSQVVVRLVDGGVGGGDRDVLLEGGLLGVSQDAEGRLEPVVGWLARPATASMQRVIERLRGGHQLEPRRPVVAGVPSTSAIGPPEIVALYDAIHAATIWPGQPCRWQLRAPADHQMIEVPLVGARTEIVTRVVDLPDGTFLARTRPKPGGTRWLRLREDLLAPVGDRGPVRLTRQQASDVPVLAGTLAELLEHALDHAGATDLAGTGESLQDLAPPRRGS